MVPSGSASRLPQQIIPKELDHSTKIITETERLIDEKLNSKGSTTPHVFYANELTEVDSIDYPPTLVASNLLQRRAFESQILDK